MFGIEFYNFRTEVVTTKSALHTITGEVPLVVNSIARREEEVAEELTSLVAEGQAANQGTIHLFTCAVRAV